MTTPQDLAAQIEALAARATPGKWYTSAFGDIPGAPQKLLGTEDGVIGSTDSVADAALISLLKNNLPAIVAALGQAEGANPVECIARAVFWHHYGLPWKNAEQVSRAEVCEMVAKMLAAGTSPAPDERDDEVKRLKAQVEAGRLFLNAANAAWAAGEPSHRVKTMLDRADQFRAAILPAKGGEA